MLVKEPRNNGTCSWDIKPGKVKPYFLFNTQPVPANPGSILYRKTCRKRPLKKKTKNGFQERLSPNAGQKYCRMLQGELYAILQTFIKLPFAIKTFVMSMSEWPLKTGFTV